MISTICQRKIAKPAGNANLLPQAFPNSFEEHDVSSAKAAINRALCSENDCDFNMTIRKHEARVVVFGCNQMYCEGNAASQHPKKKCPFKVKFYKHPNGTLLLIEYPFEDHNHKKSPQASDKGNKLPGSYLRIAPKPYQQTLVVDSSRTDEGHFSGPKAANQTPIQQHAGLSGLNQRTTGINQYDNQEKMTHVVTQIDGKVEGMLKSALFMPHRTGESLLRTDAHTRSLQFQSPVANQSGVTSFINSTKSNKDQRSQNAFGKSFLSSQRSVTAQNRETDAAGGISILHRAPQGSGSHDDVASVNAQTAATGMQYIPLYNRFISQLFQVQPQHTLPPPPPPPPPPLPPQQQQQQYQSQIPAPPQQMPVYLISRTRPATLAPASGQLNANSGPPPPGQDFSYPQQQQYQQPQQQQQPQYQQQYEQQYQQYFYRQSNLQDQQQQQQLQQQLEQHHQQQPQQQPSPPSPPPPSVVVYSYPDGFAATRKTPSQSPQPQPQLQPLSQPLRRQQHMPQQPPQQQMYYYAQPQQPQPVPQPIPQPIPQQGQQQQGRFIYISTDDNNSSDSRSSDSIRSSQPSREGYLGQPRPEPLLTPSQQQQVQHQQQQHQQRVYIGFSYGPNPIADVPLRVQQQGRGSMGGGGIGAGYGSYATIAQAQQQAAPPPSKLPSKQQQEQQQQQQLQQQQQQQLQQQQQQQQQQQYL